jgi:hypothetical protein
MVSVAAGSAKPAGAACVAPLSLLTMPRTTITPAMASTMTPITQRPLLGFALLSQPHPGPQQPEACSFGNSVFSGCFPFSFVVLIFRFVCLFFYIGCSHYAQHSLPQQLAPALRAVISRLVM